MSETPTVVEIHVIGPPGPPGASAVNEAVTRFILADDASQTYPVAAFTAGSALRVEVHPTDVSSHDWFADMLVDPAAAAILVELGIVKHITLQLAAAIGASDPDGSLNLALNVSGELKLRNRTGATAQGVVRIT